MSHDPNTGKYPGLFGLAKSYKGHSCLSELLDHIDEILAGFTDSKDTDVIYLDYAKAFDKVDHRLLIMKLKRYGIHPN